MEKSFVLQMKEKHYITNELHLGFCGYSSCEPRHTYGPAVRPNYVIHIIQSGKGKFQYGTHTFELGKNYGFFIPPNVQTTYWADEADPWSYLWIGIDGIKCEEYLRTLGITESHPVFQVNSSEKLFQVIRNMIAHRDGSEYNRFMIQGYLYHFLAELSFSIQLQLPNRSHEQTGEHVQNALRFIKKHYAEPIGITEISKHISLNRSYFSTLFKQEMGMSPKEYLTNFRITRAQALLSSTKFSVDDIAHSCGFASSISFVKAFKAMTGLTPSGFRKLMIHRETTDLKDHDISKLSI